MALSALRRGTHSENLFKFSCIQSGKLEECSLLQHLLETMHKRAGGERERTNEKSCCISYESYGSEYSYCSKVLTLPSKASCHYAPHLVFVHIHPERSDGAAFHNPFGGVPHQLPIFASPCILHRTVLTISNRHSHITLFFALSSTVFGKYNMPRKPTSTGVGPATITLLAVLGMVRLETECGGGSWSIRLTFPALFFYLTWKTLHNGKSLSTCDEIFHWVIFPAHWSLISTVAYPGVFCHRLPLNRTSL